MAPIPRLKDYQGPAILSYGFRPFFLLGALFAAVAVLLWLPFFFGETALPTALAPADWHAHEMIYGYLSAAITGFLLTAIPNWTGRLPLQGKPLLALVVVWVLGRIAVAGSALTGPLLAAVVDTAFLLLVGAAAVREIVAGRNWSNLKVVSVIALFAAGNLAFHAEAALTGRAQYGLRIGIAAVVLLITLIGGRIVPSFTRNWIVRKNPGSLPAPFGRFDAVAIVLGALALLAWVLAPDASFTGTLLCLAGAMHAVRLARWVGHRTWRDRLVIVLHLAYAFVPLGFVLLGLASFGLLPDSAGIHAWGIGAFGGMTLAVMSRASLGHTGRALQASAGTQAIYALAFAAAMARISAALATQWSVVLLHAAAAAWTGAFLGFAALYWPMLTRPRLRS